MNPDEREHRLPIPQLKKSQSGVVIIMSSLGIDSAIRIGDSDNQMGLDRTAVLLS
jgi:hypothetical protein